MLNGHIWRLLAQYSTFPKLQKVLLSNVGLLDSTNGIFKKKEEQLLRRTLLVSVSFSAKNPFFKVSMIDETLRYHDFK